MNPLIRWRSLTLLSPHSERKEKIFFNPNVNFAFFFDLHRDMQVIPDSGGEHRSIIV